MTPRPSLRPFTKACPIHPDCTLVLCRVTVQGDLPTGAAIAIDRHGSTCGVFVWARSYHPDGVGYDAGTLEAFESVLSGRNTHPTWICSVAEYHAVCQAQTGRPGYERA